MPARKAAFASICLLVMLIGGCGGSDSPPSASAPAQEAETQTQTQTSTEATKVFRNPRFSTNTHYDLVYAQGLTHSHWNSSSAATMDLNLDIYLPENNEPRRPAVIFIHGGGFSAGDKQDFAPSHFPQYFAERGFVGLSINYRLLGHYGTIPTQLNDAVNAIPNTSEEQKDQAKAMYPATRDAKAALRWLVANANQYGVDPANIAVIGGSAGSYISLARGVTEAEAFSHELSQSEDATLATTHLSETPRVKAVVEHWGGPITVDLLDTAYGLSRWDANDAPLSIVHGTDDATVPFELSAELVQHYKNTGAYHEFYPLEGAGHGAWGDDYQGSSLDALSFDFITRMLDLVVEE